MSVPENAFVTWIGDATTFAKTQFKDAVLLNSTAKKDPQTGATATTATLTVTADFVATDKQDPDSSVKFTVSSSGTGSAPFTFTAPAAFSSPPGSSTIATSKVVTDPASIVKTDSTLKAYASFKLYISSGTVSKTPDPVYEFRNATNIRIGPNLYSATTGKAIKV